MSRPALSETVIPWWTPALGEREKQLVAEVIDGNFPNDGDYTTRFEQRIAEICGVPYAVATTSGTTAIFLALVACGIGPGDGGPGSGSHLHRDRQRGVAGRRDAGARRRVGTPATLIRRAVEARLTRGRGPRAGARPRPRRRHGRPGAIAVRHGLRVVEDAAEALGSPGRTAAWHVRRCRRFSFSPNKTITTGQGGIVVTRDAALHGRLRELKEIRGGPYAAPAADEHVARA